MKNIWIVCSILCQFGLASSHANQITSKGCTPQQRPKKWRAEKVKGFQYLYSGRNLKNQLEKKEQDIIDQFKGRSTNRAPYAQRKIKSKFALNDLYKKEIELIPLKIQWVEGAPLPASIQQDMRGELNEYRSFLLKKIASQDRFMKRAKGYQEFHQIKNQYEATDSARKKLSEEKFPRDKKQWVRNQIALEKQIQSLLEKMTVLIELENAHTEDNSQHAALYANRDYYKKHIEPGIKYSTQQQIKSKQRTYASAIIASKFRQKELERKN